MAIQETRMRIERSIWQTIAQSGIDLSSVPQEQQSRLVEAITNNVLLTTNELLDETPAAQQTAPIETEGEEQVIWQGHPFLSMVEHYVLTTERIKVVTGLLGRQVENYELIRVQDIDFTQGVSERMLGIGDINITGQDPSDPKIVLRNVSKPEEVYETLRKAWLSARKRYGLQFREYM